MGYVSRRGRRPDEYASKSSHGEIVKDAAVQDFLKQCQLPRRAEDVRLPEANLIALRPPEINRIEHVIAVDGGYSEVAVQPEFPSSTICFFQFGALMFDTDDLDRLEKQAFVDPDDMSRLKRIQRLKLAIPVRNLSLATEPSLTASVRRAVFGFFMSAFEGNLIETLRWFVFEEYHRALQEYTLASCPRCEARSIPLARQSILKDYSLLCPNCGNSIFLTDVFRLHEAIDDDFGAGGIIAYLGSAIEQMIIVHIVRLILETRPSLLGQILFVRDGPLAFFGQTANMHRPMRMLVQHLYEHHDIFLAGLEKSGAFVDHADEIVQRLPSGSVLVLDNDYIYKYIVPGQGNPTDPYGRSSYYSSKLIFKTRAGSMHVVTLPTLDALVSPKEDDFHNLHETLSNIERLKCDMYDNSLVPVALANHLVSLSSHPSSTILQKLAIDAVHR